MRMIGMLALCGVVALSPLEAQTTQNAPPPVFKTSAVSKSIQAINYRHRSGSTDISFVGTAIMPRAQGQARVESRQGAISIDANFKDIGLPGQFGAEYLTYVLWAISPEGRPKNLGELLIDGGKSSLKVTTDLQVFGLVVTAEPYFSVNQPSDLIVMQNEVRPETLGKIEVVDAKYELLQRGQYQKLANVLQLTPDPKVPVEIYEARNAVQVAETSGAGRYASETFQKAVANLRQAEDYLRRKQRKPAIMIAREAAQTAEDARVIAVKREEQEALDQERQAAATREAEAKRHAEEEQRRREEAETARKSEETRRAQAEADRAAAEKQQLEAQLIAAREAAERAKAEAAQAVAAAAAEKAERDAEHARRDAEDSERGRRQAEQEKQQLRAQLLQQLNAVLETRDTDRGLVVTMADVLFDTGQATLKPGADRALDRLAQYLKDSSGTHVIIEGHTDSVGSDDYNLALSQRRAQAVADSLTSRGVSADRLQTKGLGKSYPVASNDTQAGRQQNRRVEIVFSDTSGHFAQSSP